MAQKSVKPKGVASPEIEIEPDAWDRFKRAVHKVANSPPKPHKSGSAGAHGDRPKRGRPKKSS
jgi:hypothetical protein